MDAKTLQHQFGLSGFVVEQNIASITHNDSLVQPQDDGNCLNWVLGHMVRTRIMQTQLLGITSPYELEKYAEYDTTPIKNGDHALSWESLVEQFRALQEPINEGLSRLTDEQMAAKAPFSPTQNPEETIGSLLAGISYHEAYHAGQLGILRRVCGKPGAIGTPSPEEAAA
jgi:hypothetical protein